MKANAIAAGALPPPPTPERPVTHVALLLDTSGSMYPIMDKAKKMTLDQHQHLTGEAVRTGLDVHFTFFPFSGNERSGPLVDFPDILGTREQFKALVQGINSGGSTPLYRQVEAAYLYLAPQVRRGRGDTVAIVVVTDGQDTNGGATAFQARVKDSLREDSILSLAFVGPRSVVDTLKHMGVPCGNLLVWDGTEADIPRVSQALSTGMSHYATSVKSGKRKVTNYFTTDLSGVQLRDIQSLPVVAVKAVPVKGEARIDDTVEEATGRSYMLGEAFYQLTKPELIQANKDIILRRKEDPKTYYGGPLARAVLGLKYGEDAKVTPGNHGAYDVFVQSTSANRKLVRGTTLLIKR